MNLQLDGKLGTQKFIDAYINWNPKSMVNATCAPTVSFAVL